MVGPGLVLFSRKIGMAPSYVGFLMSFTPLSLLLVVASTRLVTRFGAKRLLFGAWLMRNLLSCGVFLMPWAIRQWGPNAGAYVLVGATFGFCLMRAVGSVGWYPWLHELVPWSQRGAYFSSEMAVTQFLLVLLAVAQALVLRGDPSIARFLLIYSAGIGAGFVSLLWLSKVPGGEGGNADITEHSASAHRVALLDRPFMVSLSSRDSVMCAKPALRHPSSCTCATPSISPPNRSCSIWLREAWRYFSRFAIGRGTRSRGGAARPCS